MQRAKRSSSKALEPLGVAVVSEGPTDVRCRVSPKGKGFIVPVPNREKDPPAIRASSARSGVRRQRRMAVSQWSAAGARPTRTTNVLSARSGAGTSIEVGFCRSQRCATFPSVVQAQ